MSAMYDQDIIRIRAPYVTDPYGNPSTQRDWAVATRTTISRVSVQPDGATEDVADRHSVITGWRVITPIGRALPLESGDRVELAGGALTEVDGEVGHFTLGGRTHHGEARLRRVTG